MMPWTSCIFAQGIQLSSHQWLMEFEHAPCVFQGISPSWISAHRTQKANSSGSNIACHGLTAALVCVIICIAHAPVHRVCCWRIARHHLPSQPSVPGAAQQQHAQPAQHQSCSSSDANLPSLTCIT
eukprot:scaffold100582_cov18-Tisochrysis_lutea.AAC.1